MTDIIPLEDRTYQMCEEYTNGPEIWGRRGEMGYHPDLGSVYITAGGEGGARIGLEEFKDFARKVLAHQGEGIPEPDLGTLEKDIAKLLSETFHVSQNQRAERILELVRKSLEGGGSRPEWLNARVLRATYGGEQVVVVRDGESDWLVTSDHRSPTRIYDESQAIEQLTDVEVLVAS